MNANDWWRYRVAVRIAECLPGDARTPHQVIRAKLKKLRRRKIRFVQIGAYDGRTGDPLYPLIVKGGWEGVLVEPHPDAFAALQRTHHGRDGLRLENAAIADKDGTTELFVSPATGKPDWHRQTYSLRPEQHAQAARLGETREVYPITVASKTLRTLFEQHGVTVLDLFMVDVEGSDGMIVRQLLQTTMRPRMIVYESAFLLESEQRALLASLTEADYETIQTSVDTIATRPETD